MHETKVLKIKDAVSRNLKELRKSHGPELTQAKLAELTGVGVRTISELESGKRLPDDSTRESLCEFFGIEETDLYNDPILVSAARYMRNSK